MLCESEGETTVDTAEDTRNNEAMLLVDEQMIGFKGRHGMDSRLPHIPVGYGCQLIGETPFRLSPLPLMIKNIEQRTISICTTRVKFQLTFMIDFAITIVEGA